MNKILRKVLIAALMIFAPLSAKAIDWNYVLPVTLDSTHLTETSVLVSSTSNFSAVLSTASARRMAFDVQVTTCPATATKVWYSFDQAVSTITASASNVIDTGITANAVDRWVKQPWAVIHQGPVYMRAEVTGCYVKVREWTTSSPLFQ